jgi:hypothetical protein
VSLEWLEGFVASLDGPLTAEAVARTLLAPEIAAAGVDSCETRLRTHSGAVRARRAATP